MQRLILAVIVGVVLGATGPSYQFLGWLSLIPWGIAGLLLGYRSRSGEAARTGFLYGFSLCLAFMIAGYTGAESMVSRLPFFSLIGLLGAACGLALALTGFFLRQRR